MILNIEIQADNVPEEEKIADVLQALILVILKLTSARIEIKSVEQ